MKFIANENDIEKLKCPNCKDQFLDVEEYMNWDQGVQNPDRGGADAPPSLFVEALSRAASEELKW